MLLDHPKYGQVLKQSLNPKIIFPVNMDGFYHIGLASHTTRGKINSEIL